MKIYVLKFRESGEDCRVALFKSNEEARDSAHHFLLECVGGDIATTFEDIEQFCYDRAIAYVEIECHEI